jgi:hypothetical protein
MEGGDLLGTRHLILASKGGNVPSGIASRHLSAGIAPP